MTDEHYRHRTGDPDRVGGIDRVGDPDRAGGIGGFPPNQAWSGWRRWLFPGVWLIFLVQTAGGVHKHSGEWAAVLGYAIIIVFCYGYLRALPIGRSGRGAAFNWVLAGLSALTALETLFAHEDAFVMCVYLGVLLVAVHGRIGLFAVGGLTLLTVFLPPLIKPWHAGVDWDMAVTLPMVAFAMFGFFTIIQANRELTKARAEVARLAAENERSRIARDLHDLLGHSLTTITVKAALAHRLAQRDPARAAVEIGEVEALTRGTLADVRAAVAGYRDMSLAGELATASQVLRAAGITVSTPGAVDDVPAAYSELFGWVVREGVTNVVRHSRAQNCVITVGRDWLQISDDGRGGAIGAGTGTGLVGLRERVEAAGGTVSGARGASGWTLRVDLPAAPSPSAGTGSMAAGAGEAEPARLSPLAPRLPTR